ncbi:unnamed protein product [Polarella glacialis]|uniref:Uncharacterized protein n=1 Tax=Polarella glacialis TaxID=89957 RepID=A0A813D5E9_POLGL|nr:unnamed protein product [Polarella glacialis]
MPQSCAMRPHPATDLFKLREIVQRGIDTNSGDYDGRTAIHLAAVKGLLKVLQCLFEELEGNPNMVDRWGGIPLDDSRRAGHKEVTEYLVLMGGHCGKRTLFVDSGALLVDVSARGDAQLLRGLVGNNSPFGPSNAPGAKPVDVNAGNIDCRTALRIVAVEGNYDSVQLLIEVLGADVSLKDRWGRRLLDDASSFGHDMVANYLVSQGAISGQKPVIAKPGPSPASGDLSTADSFNDNIPVSQTEDNEEAHEFGGYWCAPRTTSVHVPAKLVAGKRVSVRLRLGQPMGPSAKLSFDLDGAEVAFGLF